MFWEWFWNLIVISKSDWEQLTIHENMLKYLEVFVDERLRDE